MEADESYLPNKRMHNHRFNKAASSLAFHDKVGGCHYFCTSLADAYTLDYGLIGRNVNILGNYGSF